MVGLWIKMCKQYRAMLALCELGLVEDAETIVRSLFESTLHIHFLLKRWPKRSQGWRTAPRLPKAIEVRADVYLARDALEEDKRLNVWKNSRGCRRAARRIAPAAAAMLASAESMVGCDWMKWLRSDQGKGAFKVEMMSKNFGLQRWYDAVYRTQSRIAHGGDALDHLQPSDPPMTMDAGIGGDIQGAAGPLRLANALFGRAAQLIDWRFSLQMRKQFKNLADGARALTTDA